MDVLHEAFWAIVPGIIVGVVMAVWNKWQKAGEQRQREREQNADKGEVLKLSLLVAAAQLSYAVAMAVKRGKPNGEIEVGVQQYNVAMEKFRNYEREMISKGM